MSSNVQVSVTSILKKVYPVGSIYFSVNSTNPGTSLGFGTWSAFGAGKVPVGFDSGDTDFDTDEETGGAKTVAHTHALSDSAYGQITQNNNGVFMRLVTGITSWTSNRPRSWSTVSTPSNAANTEGIALRGDTDSTSPSVVQPYIVVRMWKRTA